MTAPLSKQGNIEITLPYGAVRVGPVKKERNIREQRFEFTLRYVREEDIKTIIVDGEGKELYHG